MCGRVIDRGRSGLGMNPVLRVAQSIVRCEEMLTHWDCELFGDIPREITRMEKLLSHV